MIGEEDFYYEETEVDEATYLAIFNHHSHPLSPSHNSDGLSSGRSFSSSSPATSPVCSTDSSSSTVSATSGSGGSPGRPDAGRSVSSSSSAGPNGQSFASSIDWSHFLQDQSQLLHAAYSSNSSLALADKGGAWRPVNAAPAHLYSPHHLQARNQPNLLQYHFSHLAHQQRAHHHHHHHHNHQLNQRQQAYRSPAPRKRQQQSAGRRKGALVSPRRGPSGDWRAPVGASSPPPLLDRAPSKSPPPAAESPGLALGPHRLQFPLQLSAGSLSPAVVGVEGQQPRPAHLNEPERLVHLAKSTKDHDHTYNSTSPASSPRISSSSSPSSASVSPLSPTSSSSSSGAAALVAAAGRPASDGDSKSATRGANQRLADAPPKLTEAPPPTLAGGRGEFVYKQRSSSNTPEQQCGAGQINGINLSSPSGGPKKSPTFLQTGQQQAPGDGHPQPGSILGATSMRRVRGENRKCRKVYGMERRDQWCTQCKWKKACSRFCDQ